MASIHVETIIQAPADRVWAALSAIGEAHRTFAGVLSGCRLEREEIETVAAASGAGLAGRPPQVLLVAPPPISEIGFLAAMFEGGAQKSRNLAVLYKAVAQQTGVAFVDAGPVAEVSAVDGVHLERDQHLKLGKAIAERVRSMFQEPAGVLR